MRSYLPEKGTPEAGEIILLYPTASPELMEEWVKRYNYSNRNTFTDAIFRTYGVRRNIKQEIIERKVKPPVEPLRLKTNAGFETMAVINDTQHPHHDEKALDLVERFLADLQPDYLAYNGDMCDFYQISRFDKDPARITDLQSDINSMKAMYRRNRKAMPNTRMFEIDGNHEDRWQKFLWSKASELSSLTCLTLDELFDLKEYEIERVHYERGLMINGIFLTIHGDISSVHSGYTAKRMYEKHGGCGICGHCHRGGSYFKRDRFGTWGWWENFCLCSLHPDWIQNPNWVQGFSLVHFHGSRFWVEQIPILGHSFIYGGKLYE